eukprot:scaffold159145_cov37-Prasinocladus_malaysianus.AAC.1
MGISLWQLLIGKGLPLDAKTRAGKTALMGAAENGHEGCVSALLDAGASPTVLMHDETGPVTLAARGGHLSVMKLLVAEGGSTT